MPLKADDEASAATMVVQQSSPRFDVLNNTDFGGGAALGGGKASSIAACAQMCLRVPHCAAASWNGPRSFFKDANCNLKCNALLPVHVQGELGVVVRNLSFCPPPEISAPPGWVKRHEAGQLLFSMDTHLDQRWLPNIGNGLLASQVGSQWMFAADVYTGAVDASRLSPPTSPSAGLPHRARIPVPYNVFPVAQKLGTALDVERGVAEVIFELDSAHIVQRTYFHQNIPHLAITDLTFNNSNSTSSSPLWLPLRDTFLTTSPDFTFRTVVQNSTVTCIEGTTRQRQTTLSPLVTVAVCRANPARGLSVAAGSVAHLTLPASIWSSLDRLPRGVHSPLQAAQDEVMALVPGGASSSLRPPSLYDSHLRGMSTLWQSGVEIEGNAELAVLTNVSLWNLLLSFRAQLNSTSGGGGLCNNCFNGHVFWGQEIFSDPTLTFFWPRLAASSLQYRFDRRAAAAAKAAQGGFVGLQYPWESSGTLGLESIPPGGTATFELHVSADIAFAYWQYFQATGDLHWLRSTGWPVLRGIATFFASRCTTLADGTVGLLDVQDVIEQDYKINNSAYTNAAVKLCLFNAMTAAKVLGMTNTSIPANWSRIAALLPLPQRVRSDQPPHLEFEGQNSDVNGLGGGPLSRIGNCSWLNSTTLESVNDCAGVGVIMMRGALGIPAAWSNFSDENVKADMRFYDNPHLGGFVAFNTIALLRLREFGAAAADWRMLATPGVDYGAKGPFLTFYDGAHCLNFLMLTGSFLQGLWAGWAGAQVSDSALTFWNPTIPPNTTAIKLRAISFQGIRLNVHITNTSISLCLSASQSSIRSVALFAQQFTGMGVYGRPLQLTNVDTIFDTTKWGASGSCGVRVSLRADATTSRQ